MGHTQLSSGVTPSSALQGSLLVDLEEPYVVLRTKPKLAVCRQVPYLLYYHQPQASDFKFVK